MDKRNSHNLLTISYLLVSIYRNYAVFIIDYLPIQKVKCNINQHVTINILKTMPLIKPKYLKKGN
ncbi:hypothetical protein N180_01205 [Pedobacter antarcticus 4BY]|uniref:Uncharacterized protein n=2 Tax=Pedobacter antarcticus TaxID=34086 RepID=A0A081PC57_9SPHI|nr:hypothetical protein N180_01205 [Pedobacter antarcticus 4BY]SFE47582.1 hypothetical protein SAMN03003324_00607 [Pedobacter antarcticus]